MRKDFYMIEPNKDIILHCSDFAGDYKVHGQMIPYKKPVGKRKQRFCVFDPLTKDWENSQHWHQREGWEYKQAPTAQKDSEK